jgi:tetratricopeptide (TPR) repeat protein
LIVTSRLEFTLDEMNAINLEKLQPEKAVELLRMIVRTTRPLEVERYEGQVWEEIARLCGYLPLALRAAGSMLANTRDLSPAEYAEQLQDEHNRIERIGSQGADLDVKACFNLSYRHLDSETARVFRMLSIFPADFDAKAEEVVCRDEGHQHLSKLVRFSLAKFQCSKLSDQGRYNLHDLVRLFSAARLAEEDDEVDIFTARLRHAKHFMQVLSASDELFLQGGAKLKLGLELFDIEWANIQAGQIWSAATTQASRKANVADMPALKLASDYPSAGAYVLSMRLYPRDMIRWLESGLAAARKIEDDAAVWEHLGNLGNAYQEIGDIRKAIESTKQLLAIYHQIGDRRNEGAALANLGVAYYKLGDPRKAIEYLEQALTLSREFGNRISESKDLANLGEAYNAIGYARKAIEYCEQALAIDREIGNRQGEGTTLGALGIAYSHLGDAKKAIEYLEQTLAISQEIGDLKNEGTALTNLGKAWLDFGDARKAIEYCEQALAIDREIGSRQGEAASLGTLGIAYITQGDAKKAIGYHEQALDLYRGVGDRRNESAALRSLAVAYGIVGDAKKAIELLRQELSIDKERGDRWSVGYCLGCLGLAYDVLGDAKKAIEYYQQHLIIAREMGDRSGEGNALWSMSRSVDKLGQRAKAIELAKSALEIFEQIENPAAEEVRKILAEWQK